MNTDLAIRITGDASDAVRAVDSVGDSYDRMASQVDDATRRADSASSRLDSAAESADGMASSSSQAAGGLGDLGGALSLLPGPLGAMGAGMEAAAPAIMGVTGASDLVNLALKSTVVTTARARAAAVAHAVTSRAQAAATRTAAIAQRVFNAAMRANPIGLIITAILLVAGAFVLAYKRSETFRNIVNAVVERVKAFVGGLIDRVKGIPDAFAAARDKVADVLARVRELLGTAADKVRDVGTTVRDALGSAFDWVLDKIQPIIDAIQWVLDKLGSIDFPDIPFLGRTTSGGTTSTSTTSAGEQYVFHFHGITPADEDALGRQIERAMAKRRRATGRQLVIVP